MPIGEAVYLGFVITAFVVFGITLAAASWYEQSGARRQQPAQRPTNTKPQYKLAA